jgi:hypothetical protein
VSPPKFDGHTFRNARSDHIANGGAVRGAESFRKVADVEDPAANLVGIAAAASEGAVTAAQLDQRPIVCAGEVLETVPGLIVSQHSREGKLNH